MSLNFPTNKQACYFAKNYLSDYRKGSGVGPALRAIFEVTCGGINCVAKYNNLLPIVEFAKHEQSFLNTVPTGKEPELHNFRSKLDSIATHFKSLALKADKAGDLLLTDYYKGQEQYVRELIRESRDEPGFMHFCNFYQLVIDNWKDLKDWSVTYQMLHYLAMMEKGWDDSPETRAKLLELLCEVSSEWDD